jgi:hypothetical protein
MEPSAQRRFRIAYRKTWNSLMAEDRKSELDQLSSLALHPQMTAREILVFGF